MKAFYQEGIKDWKLLPVKYETWDAVKRSIDKANQTRIQIKRVLYETLRHGLSDTPVDRWTLDHVVQHESVMQIATGWTVNTASSTRKLETIVHDGTPKIRFYDNDAGNDFDVEYTFLEADGDTPDGTYMPWVEWKYYINTDGRVYTIIKDEDGDEIVKLYFYPATPEIRTYESGVAADIGFEYSTGVEYTIRVVFTGADEHEIYIDGEYYGTYENENAFAANDVITSIKWDNTPSGNTCDIYIRDIKTSWDSEPIDPPLLYGTPRLSTGSLVNTTIHRNSNCDIFGLQIAGEDMIAMHDRNSSGNTAITFDLEASPETPGIENQYWIGFPVWIGKERLTISIDDASSVETLQFRFDSGILYYRNSSTWVDSGIDYIEDMLYTLKIKVRDDDHHDLFLWNGTMPNLGICQVAIDLENKNAWTDVIDIIQMATDSTLDATLVATGAPVLSYDTETKGWTKDNKWWQWIPVAIVADDTTTWIEDFEWIHAEDDLSIEYVNGFKNLVDPDGNTTYLLEEVDGRGFTLHVDDDSLVNASYMYLYFPEASPFPPSAKHEYTVRFKWRCNVGSNNTNMSIYIGESDGDIWSRWSVQVPNWNLYLYQGGTQLTALGTVTKGTWYELEIGMSDTIRYRLREVDGEWGDWDDNTGSGYPLGSAFDSPLTRMVILCQSVYACDYNIDDIQCSWIPQDVDTIVDRLNDGIDNVDLLSYVILRPVAHDFDGVVLTCEDPHAQFLREKYDLDDNVVEQHYVESVDDYDTVTLSRVKEQGKSPGFSADEHNGRTLRIEPRARETRKYIVESNSDIDHDFNAGNYDSTIPAGGTPTEDYTQLNDGLDVSNSAFFASGTKAIGSADEFYVELDVAFHDGFIPTATMVVVAWVAFHINGDEGIEWDDAYPSIQIYNHATTSWETIKNYVDIDKDSDRQKIRIPIVFEKINEYLSSNKMKFRINSGNYDDATITSTCCINLSEFFVECDSYETGRSAREWNILDGDADSLDLDTTEGTDDLIVDRRAWGEVAKILYTNKELMEDISIDRALHVSSITTPTASISSFTNLKDKRVEQIQRDVKSIENWYARMTRNTTNSKPAMIMHERENPPVHGLVIYPEHMTIHPSHNVEMMQKVRSVTVQNDDTSASYPIDPPPISNFPNQPVTRKNYPSPYLATAAQSIYNQRNELEPSVSLVCDKISYGVETFQHLDAERDGGVDIPTRSHRWSWSDGVGTSTFLTHPHGNNIVGRLTKIGTGASTVASYSWIGGSRTFVNNDAVSFTVRPGQDTEWFSIYINRQGPATAAQIMFHHGGNIIAINNAATPALVSYDGNIDYHVNVTFVSSTTYKVEVNGTEYDNGGSYYTVAGGTAITSLEEMSIYGHSNEVGWIEIDDIQVSWHSFVDEDFNAFGQDVDDEIEWDVNASMSATIHRTNTNDMQSVYITASGASNQYATLDFKTPDPKTPCLDYNPWVEWKMKVLEANANVWIRDDGSASIIRLWVHPTTGKIYTFQSGATLEVARGIHDDFDWHTYRVVFIDDDHHVMYIDGTLYTNGGDPYENNNEFITYGDYITDIRFMIVGSSDATFFVNDIRCSWMDAVPIQDVPPAYLTEGMNVEARYAPSTIEGTDYNAVQRGVIKNLSWMQRGKETLAALDIGFDDAGVESLEEIRNDAIVRSRSE